MKNTHMLFESRLPAQVFRNSWGWHSRATRLVVGTALSLALGCVSHRAEAGSLSAGFEPDEAVPGVLYGFAAVDAAGGVNNSGALKMNTANGQSGFLVSADLD